MAARAAARSDMRSGIGELDRVLGGGLVAGSIVLLGGEPGIGKSTLVLAAGGRDSRRAWRLGRCCMPRARNRWTSYGCARTASGCAGASADQIAIISETGVQAIAGVAERDRAVAADRRLGPDADVG